MTKLEAHLIKRGNPIMVKKEHLENGAKFLISNAELVETRCTPYVDTAKYINGNDTFTIIYLNEEIISIEANTIIFMS